MLYLIQKYKPDLAVSCEVSGRVFCSWCRLRRHSFLLCAFHTRQQAAWYYGACNKRGQAAIASVIFFLAIWLTTGAGVMSFSIRQSQSSRLYMSSLKTYTAAESGVEDVMYRLINNMSVDATEVLMLNGGTVTTTINNTGDEQEVTSDADVRDAVRSIRAVLAESTTGTSFAYGAQVGYLGLEMNQNTSVTGSVYSNGSIEGASHAKITGDAWVAAGTATTTDQEQSSQTDNLKIRDAAARQDAGQSFVPSITATVSKISLYIRKVGTPSNATIFIVPDNGGVPDNDGEVADGTLNAGNVTASYGWVDVALDANLGLNANATYWIILDNGSNHASRYFVLGGAADTAYPQGTFLYSADWDAGSPAWTEPSQGARDAAFRVYMGETNTKLEDMEVGGNAHAHAIDDSDIDGDAYYQTIDDSTVGGVSHPGSEDPAPLNLPLSEGQIDEMKSWGDSGGTCVLPTCDASGNYILDDETGTLGPIRILGDMTVDNGAALTINGTIHVEGDVILNNNCTVQLASSYGAESGMIVADGTIRVDSGCTLLGSGDAESYLMLITTSQQLENPPALNLNNNAEGAIFYASRGAVEIDNNATVQEVIAEKLILRNNAGLEYQSGLADVQFSAGPTGGYEINRWEEID